MMLAILLAVVVGGRYARASEHEVAIASSIAYAAGARRTLDVYAPRGARDAPVVVFFYGGSWQNGSKDTYGFLAKSLASQGLVVVVPDYRVYPETGFPGFLEDGAQAVGWVKTHAAQFGGNPRRMFLMGHSAGAYNAAMLSYDNQWLARVGITARRDLAGFIGIAGPYDFLPIQDPAIKKIFAVADLNKTQPINFINGGEPPSFIAAPSSDVTVDPGNSKRLAARLRSRGGDVTEKAYSNILVGHVTIIGAFAPLAGIIAPVRDDVVSFVERIAGAKP